MMILAPELHVWKDEAAFLAGELPSATYGLGFLDNSDAEEGAGTFPRYFLTDDAVVPDGAYVLIEHLRFESNATLYCASTTTPHRLAPWHLAGGGAKKGDVVTFDGAVWVPHSPGLPDVPFMDNQMPVVDGQLPVVATLDVLPPQIGCAAVLNTTPPKLILRGSDGLIYDALGNLLQ